MVFGLFKKKPTLAKRCQTYLETGLPASMTNYVPGSLTEIIIGHGANQVQLDPELQEVATIILFEAEDMSNGDNKAVNEYMKQGVLLVREIIDS